MKRGIRSDLSSRLQKKGREGAAEKRSCLSPGVYVSYQLRPAEPKTGQMSHSIRPKVLTDKTGSIFQRVKYPGLRLSPEETGTTRLFHKRVLRHHQEVVRSSTLSSSQGDKFLVSVWR